MSDARPITDVTDYVCGSCWGSFNSGAPGVSIDADSGEPGAVARIRCPHCGHIQLGGRSIVDAVNAATASGLGAASGGFTSDEPNADERAMVSVTAAPATPAPQTPAEITSPELPAAVFEETSPAIVPSAASRQTAAHGSPQSDSAVRPSDDELFAVFAATLDNATHGRVVGPAVVKRGASAPFTAVTVGDAELGFADGSSVSDLTDPEADLDAIEAGFAAVNAGTDAGVTVDGKTENANAVHDPLAEQNGLFDLDPFDQDTGEFEAAEIGQALHVSAQNTAPQAPSQAVEPEPTEWKLKAPPGLTYNFHSLDGLVGWVGTKDPNAMQISIDSETWRPFAPFLDAARDGLTGRQSWDIAGGAPIHVRHGSMRSAMDDIAELDAVAMAQASLRLAPSLSFGDETDTQDDASTDEDDAIADFGHDAAESASVAGASGGAASPTRAKPVDDLTRPDSHSSDRFPAAPAAETAPTAGSGAASTRSHRATGARPMPQKIALEKENSRSPLIVIAVVVVLIGAVAAALFATGRL